MSRRSLAAFYAPLERPIAWCQRNGCRNRGARYSKHDDMRLCKTCREAIRNLVPPATKENK